MEHIVQFAIGIDDNAIVEKVSAMAEHKIMEDLTNDVRKIVFEINPWSRSTRNIPSEWTKMRVEDFLEKHRDDIIDAAAMVLADRLVRTKAVREAVNGIISGERK